MWAYRAHLQQAAGSATAGVTLTADAGSYALTGTSASIIHKWVVSAGAGSYALTGTSATLRKNLPLVADAGSYALTGSNASILHKWIVTAGAGSYALTGTDATLNVGKRLTALGGSYSVSGTSASVLHAWKLFATDVGSYALTGTSATIAPSSPSPSLVADPGSYLLSGTSASILHKWIVTAGAGSYLLTGSSVTLTIAEARASGGDGGFGGDPGIRRRRKQKHVTKQRLEELLFSKAEEAPAPTPERVQALQEEIMYEVGEGLLGPQGLMVERFIQDSIAREYQSSMDWGALAAVIEQIKRAAVAEVARIEGIRQEVERLAAIEAELDYEDELILFMI